MQPDSTEERDGITPPAPGPAGDGPPERGAPDAEQLIELQDRVASHMEEGDHEDAVAELAELRAPDRADVLRELEASHRQELLGSLSPEAVAEVVEYLDVGDAVELSGLIDVTRMASVLDRASPDVAADILRGIDWEDASQIMARMQDRRAIGALLLYKDDDAGGLMSPEVVALRDAWPAPHAINVLRASGLDPNDMRQLFVVDSRGILVGHLELPELVFAQPGSMVSDVMNRDVISVETGTDQEEAARLMERYEIRSLPVVDVVGRLEGAISIEDLVQVVEQEATEDMYRMIGVSGGHRFSDSLVAGLRSRLPWLTVNLGSVLLAGVVLSLFESTLADLTVLAVFLPVVMGQAGISGTQTLTIIVRSMALGEVATRDARQLVLRELALAVIQGLTVGLVLTLIVWAWQRDGYLALVVASALLLNLLIAALSGVLVPLGLRAFKADPATSSAVLVTTLTDLAGIAVYLGLATAFISSFNLD